MKWDKPKVKSMLRFEKETGNNAIWNGKITDAYENWLFKNDMKSLEKPRKGSLLAGIFVSPTNPTRTIKLKLAILKDFEIFGGPSARYAFVDPSRTFYHFPRNLYSGGPTGSGFDPYDIRRFKKDRSDMSGYVEFVKFV